VGLGRLTDAIIGSTTQLNGLAATPTSPASLAVNIGSGEIYILEPTDPTAYGVLPIDNTNIMKQGILEATLELSTPAPAGVGNSVKYLIQVGFLEVDDGSTLRQFYNSSNPSSPIFNTVNTQRTDSAVVQAKSGTPAPTGTEVAPLPDAGFVGAWVVTVANGQTTVTAGNIALSVGAPFITDKLKDKITQTQGDARYKQLPALVANATMSATQNVAGSTSAKLTFNTISFDPFSFWFAGGTRFNLYKVGYYRINGFVKCNASFGGDTIISLNVYLNGVFHEELGQPNVRNTADVGASGSIILFSNGTDYAELFLATAAFGVGVYAGNYFQIEYLGT
jgi:hypothetical protein